SGKPPFEGEAGDVLKKVQSGDFMPPRHVQPSIPPPLEAVCLKAMALAPADRYATTRELAEEIERWLADEPVRAWPEPWRVRARRWANRHRVLVTSAAAGLVVAAVGLVVGLVIVQKAYTQASHDRQEALASAASEKTARKMAHWLLYFSLNQRLRG